MKKQQDIPMYKTTQKLSLLRSYMKEGNHDSSEKILKELDLDSRLGIIDTSEDTKSSFLNLLPDISSFFKGNLKMELIIKSIDNKLKEEGEDDVNR